MTYHGYEIFHVQGHYEIGDSDGETICTADTVEEAKKEIDVLVEEVEICIG